MSHPRLSGLAAVAALALLCGSAAVAQPLTERLSVPLTDPARPARIEVSLVQGSITVTGAAVREVIVEVTGRDAELRPRSRSRGDGDRAGLRRIPNTVFGVELEERDNRVEISTDSWRQPTDLKITVPVASALVLSTVNGGEVAVDGVEGELELHNTNGAIRVAGARGPVSASTVNGKVEVAFRANAIAAAPMAFSTLNGDVEVTMPAALKADIRMRSVNGEIYSDFDIAITQGEPEIEEKRSGGKYRYVLSREMRGKVGGGGPELLLKTFNGDIVLRRAGG